VGAAAGAWLAGVAVALAVEPQGWGTGHAALAAAQMYWLVRLPELTLIAAPAIMTWLIWTEPPAAYAAAVAALAYGWAAARHRIDVRRRQRLLAANAAQGVRLALPQPVPPLRRGAVRIGAGVALAVPAIWGRAASPPPPRDASCTRLQPPVSGASTWRWQSSATCATEAAAPPGSPPAPPPCGTSCRRP
jgi:hypothetical protein